MLNSRDWVKHQHAEVAIITSRSHEHLLSAETRTYNRLPLTGREKLTDWWRRMEKKACSCTVTAMLTSELETQLPINRWLRPSRKKWRRPSKKATRVARGGHKQNYAWLEQIHILQFNPTHSCMYVHVPVCTRKYEHVHACIPVYLNLIDLHTCRSLLLSIFLNHTVFF